MKTVIYLGAPEGYDAANDILHDIAEVKHIVADDGVISSALRNSSAVLDASMKVHITDAMIANAPNLFTELLLDPASLPSRVNAPADGLPCGVPVPSGRGGLSS